MAAHTISRTTLVAVLVAIFAALIARSWLQIQLTAGGMQKLVAADLSYLVVPPVLILLLFPLWRSEKAFLAKQFSRTDLTWKLALTAVAIGVLIRLLWWSQLIAGVSFGVYASSDPEAVVGPIISFQCGSPGVVLLGFLVMTMIVPLIEEIVHRGYVQTAMQHRGIVLAILTSAFVFAFFHKMTSWPFAFLAGVVLGMQYWATRSLWSSLISHAVINGLAQIDWRCMSGQWNPRQSDLPILVPGLVTTTIGIVCLTALMILLRQMFTGAPKTLR